jgi:ABC-type branched-subunit amino acid transport system substrate-binding protein
MTFAPISTAGSSGADTYDQIRVGALAAAQAINDAGGVNGKAIKIEVCDTKGDSNQAVSCAQQAAQEHLPAVVGVFDPGGTYLSELQKAEIPALGAVGLSAEYTSPVAFPVYNGLEIYLGLFALMAQKGVHDIAFPYQDRPGVQASLTPIINAGKALGLSITLIPVEANQSDYSPVVARAQAHKGIIIGLLDNQAIPFVQTLRQTGYKGLVGGSMGAAAIKTLGQDAGGLYSVNAYLPATDVSVPAVQTYVNAMDAIDPHASKDDFSANAYNSVLMFAKAVTGMTDVTGGNLIQKLTTIGPISTGFRPAVSFAKPPASAQKQFATLPRLFDVNIVFEQVSNGQLTAISGTFHDAITGAAIPFS